MAFRVYLSYSLDPREMTLAWRLQTLAAAHGIEMYVPNYGGTNLPGTVPIETAIDRADCVLAILTAATTVNVQNELSYALRKQKLVVPIVRHDLASDPSLKGFHQVFVFSPWEDPGETETRIVEFLKKQRLTKEGLQTVGALAALGLGLLVLVALNKE